MEILMHFFKYFHLHFYKKRKENITALEFLQDIINLIQLKNYNFICMTVEEMDIIFYNGVFTHFL